MKKVSFLDRTWEVPLWANFITQDLNNGAVCVWERAPVSSASGWVVSTDHWLNPGNKMCLDHVPVRPTIMVI